MPYKISWYRDQRVMLVTLSGAVSNEELAQVESESFELMQNAPDVVHALTDMREVTSIAPNLGAAFSSFRRQKHANQGMTIIVLPTLNVFAKFVTSTLMQLLRLQYRLCTTMEEAISVLDRIDVRFSDEK